MKFICAALVILLTSTSAENVEDGFIVEGTSTVRGLSRCHGGNCTPPPRPVLGELVPQHVEVQEIIKEKRCPVNMELQGERCVGVDYFDACPVCPHGTFMVNGQCLTTARPVVECPAGFDMSKGRCRSCESFPADFQCPREDQVLDGTCCRTTIPQAPVCPAGFTKKDGQCVRLLASSVECAAGYHLSGRQCVRETVEQATVVCPEGSSLLEDGQKCVIVKQAPPHCPSGFNFNGQSCAKVVPQVVVPCPESYRKLGTTCERTDRFPANYCCPADMVLEGRQCVKEVPIPPRCGAGFQMSADGSICERVVPEVPVCPEGSKPIGAGRALRCQSVLEHDSTECCPPGFELVGGRCRGEERSAPKLSCESECYTTRRTKVAFACPQETEFFDQPAAPKCMASSCAHQTMRCMKEQKKVGRSLQSCAACQAVVAERHCPDGGELEGDYCVVRTPVVPEKLCRVGTLDEVSGQCVREIFVPAKSECPAGTQRQGKICVSYETQEPGLVCPPNSQTGDNGCCVVTQDLIVTAPRVVRAPATPECASGSLSGSECLEVSRVPQEFECPEGASRDDNGRCVVPADLIVPAPVEKFVRPSFVCPAGTRTQGCECHGLETVEPECVCPEDSYLENGKCVRLAELVEVAPKVLTAPAVPVCPLGTTKKGVTCLASHETEPIVSCPVDYELVGKKCVKTVTPNFTCPNGTSLSGSSCARQTVTSPVIKVVKGCVHTVEPSCETCPREVVSTCRH